MNTTTSESGTDEGKLARPRRPEAGERERVVAEWAASGKTVDEMAAKTGWSTFTLYRWRLDAGQGKRSRPKVAPSPPTKLLSVPRPALEIPGSLGGGGDDRLRDKRSLFRRVVRPAWAAQLFGS